MEVKVVGFFTIGITKIFRCLKGKESSCHQYLLCATKSCVFITIRKEPFENVIEKEENAD